MNDFLKIIMNRRSIYAISEEQVLSDEKLTELIETVVKHVPYAFNSQTGRVILLTGGSHKKLWNIVLDTLRGVTPEAKFKATEDKIASFSAGYGTILFFEEQSTIEHLQEQFPLYVDHFPSWSLQASGMLQFAMWNALEQEGMGASLQHYNPLIDASVAAAFEVPESWTLISQMPFGKSMGGAGEKTFLPIDSRVKILN